MKALIISVAVAVSLVSSFYIGLEYSKIKDESVGRSFDGARFLMYKETLDNVDFYCFRDKLTQKETEIIKIR